MTQTKVGAFAYIAMIVAPIIVAIWYVLQPNDLMPAQPLDDAIVALTMAGGSLWTARNFQQ